MIYLVYIVFQQKSHYHQNMTTNDLHQIGQLLDERLKPLEMKVDRLETKVDILIVDVNDL